MFEIIIYKNGVEIQVVPLNEPVSVMGRQEGNQILLAEDSVSRKHARLLLENGRVFLEDLRSGNGTYFRNKRLDGRVELKEGDEFSISPFSLKLRSPVPSTQLLPPPMQPDARTVMIPAMGQPAPAALDPARTGARLILRRGDAAKSSYVMGTNPISIGRSEDRDVVLTDPASSRRHARITWMGDHFYIRDEGSANGIMINGTVCREGALKPGDRVVIGETEFEYVWPGAPAPAAPPNPFAQGLPNSFAGGFPAPPGAPSPGIDPYSETGIMPAYPQWPGAQPSMPGQPMPGMPMPGMPMPGQPGAYAGGMTELGIPATPKKSPIRLVALGVVIVLFSAIGIKTVMDRGKPTQATVAVVQTDKCEGVGETCTDPTNKECMDCLTKRARFSRGLELFQQGEYGESAQEFGRILTDLDPADVRAARFRYISYEFWVLSTMEDTLRDRSQTDTQKIQRIKEDYTKAKELWDRYGRASYTRDTPEATLATARNGLSEAVNLLTAVGKITTEDKDAKAAQKEADTLRRNALAQINRLRTIKEASAQEAFVQTIQQLFEEANAAKNSGNLGKAAAKYKEVIDKDSARKTQYPGMAQAELESLNKAMKDRAKPLVAEASQRMKSEQWPEARAKLVEALKIDPNLEEAQSKLRQVEQECMSQASKLFSEARLQYNVQQFNQAEKLLRKVLILVPDKGEEIHQKSLKLLRDMGKE